MPKIRRSFTHGRMNKSVDERLIPDGEYIDAVNLNFDKVGGKDGGVGTGVAGTVQMSALTYSDGTPISANAVCIGSVVDENTRRIFWFVHDPSFQFGVKLDMVVSLDIDTTNIVYHLIDKANGFGLNTMLNFSPSSLISSAIVVDDFLLFTDGVNQPRKINIRKAYPETTTVEDDILLVKAPPVGPLTMTLTTGDADDSFMADKFVCFAYRYRYDNNEFSALSQFTQPAFMPGSFEYDQNNFTNDGMRNTVTTVGLTYNSGGKNVVGIEVVSKESNGNIIKVIHRINKAISGIADNTDNTVTVNSDKFINIIADYELLRLYDNVPTSAKAMTLMGNRLMFGNYTEGFDMTDKNGLDVNIDYTVSLESYLGGNLSIPSSVAASSYLIDGPVSVDGSSISINLSGAILSEGFILSVQFKYQHGYFSGINTSSISGETQPTLIDFTYLLTRNYATVYELATSAEFLYAIGTTVNMTVDLQAGSYNQNLTDVFNFSVANSLAINPSGASVRTSSGIDAINTPIKVGCLLGSDIITLQLPAVKYTGDLLFYEYYTVTAVTAVLTAPKASDKSLHSNRDYSVGIVYMDDYGRSSPVLMSENSSVFIDAGKSANVNKLAINIPVSQAAPIWAKRYKFAIKQNKGAYETIFSSVFFKDPASQSYYYLLEGENAQKVSVDDKLIVKSDAYGALNSLVEVSVIEKEAKAENFVTITDVIVPSGVYMKISSDKFFPGVGDYFNPGLKSVSTDANFIDTVREYPLVAYPLFENGSNVKVPAGARIKMHIKFNRIGVGECEQRTYTLDKSLTSTKDYADVYDWFIGDNIAPVLDMGTKTVGGAGNCNISNSFFVTKSTNPDFYAVMEKSECTNHYRFFDIAGSLYFIAVGTVSCNGILGQDSRRSTAEVSIQIYSAESQAIVFETKPLNADENTYFESDESFMVDSVSGNHLGNVQNQDISNGIPCIVRTSFYNCFTFANGIESYKINDSITGNSFGLGNRVCVQSYNEFSSVRKNAHITWSGVYNDDTGINRMNEFNLGLLNYKSMEDSFGDIQVLDGRETDVLVLQQDKISYALAGKNLLSDAAAGGTISSIPEVIGTQISRVENFGISNNPESYCVFGASRFFVDERRGVALMLSGTSYQNDTLEVISNIGMRSWFKDLFNDTADKVKLGGYDPYNNQYVLSSIDRDIQKESEVLPVGAIININSD